jgi:Tfp pilus assembly protein PilF
MKKSPQLPEVTPHGFRVKNWHIAAVLLFTALAYSPILQNGFLLDDFGLLNERIAWVKSPGHSADLVLKPYWYGVQSGAEKFYLYRPWVSFTHWAEHWIGGGSPWAYHISNLLVHLGTVLLLFLFLKMLMSSNIALIVSSLFAVTPAALSSVGWISDRTDLWSFLFMLLFMIFMHRSKGANRVRNMVGAGISFFLALCSKETALVAPVLYFVIEIVERKRIGVSQVPSRAWQRFAVLLVPLGAYYLLWRNALGGNSMLPVGGQKVLASIPYLPEQLLRSAWHILLPVRFDFFNELLWSLPAQRGMAFIAGWILLVSLFVVTVYGLSKGQWWAVGSTWFGLMLLIPYASGQTFAPIADFYAYAGIPGLWLMVSDGIRVLAARKAPSRRLDRLRWVPCLVGTVSALFGVLIFLRLPLMKSGYSLFTHEVAVRPTSSMAANRLADEYWADGNQSVALQWVERAISLDSTSVPLRIKAAVGLMDAGDIKAAGPHVDALNRLAPYDVTSRSVIARFYFEAGHCSEAVERYQDIIAVAQPTPELLFDYGMALLCNHQDSLAAGVYGAALQQRPNWPHAWNNLGLAYENMGDLAHALQAYRKAVQIDPGFANGWESLVMTCIKIGKMDEARAAAEQYYRLSPPPQRVQRLRDMLGETDRRP